MQLAALLAIVPSANAPNRAMSGGASCLQGAVQLLASVSLGFKSCCILWPRGPRGPFSGKKPPKFLPRITQRDLDYVMYRAAKGAQTWDEGSFVRVKQLQEAVRNFGGVELMRTKCGHHFVVKRMPTEWVCKSHRDFVKTHPTSTELPWLDIGIVQYLNDLSFPFACKMLGIFQNETETFVATTYCSRGDLFGWVDSDTSPEPGPRREKVMVDLATQIFSGVRWLHELGIAHRDLSLENLLLTGGKGQLHVQIIDFGMATASRYARNELCGKASYQAPEMHLSQECDCFLFDSFALGVILFSMASQDYPWMSTKRGVCPLFDYAVTFGIARFLERRKLRKGRGERLADVFSEQLTKTIEALVSPDSELRASLGESCYTSSAASKDRTSVWRLAWVQQGPGLQWTRGRRSQS
mmetsp:Transcript_42798/g.123711  ORF Transcript_42798/g.123711 Transcript_42798/m.123711 type:complete len:411 (-) Transcript_42798:30-1262(-)